MAKRSRCALTDKNVLDLGTALDSTLQEAAASPENKEKEEWLRKTWVLPLTLRVPGAAYFEVPYAIFDEDPIPGFKASVKKAGRLFKEAVGADERRVAMAAAWSTVFRKITGDQLNQLPSGGSVFCSSNGPDGKKWIVTKLVQIKGKPVCWCIPVEVKTGKETSVTLTEDNVFDLGSVTETLRGQAPQNDVRGAALLHPLRLTRGGVDFRTTAGIASSRSEGAGTNLSPGRMTRQSTIPPCRPR